MICLNFKKQLVRIYPNVHPHSLRSGRQVLARYQLSDSNTTTKSIFLIYLAILFMRSLFDCTSGIFEVVSVILVSLLPSGSQIV